MKLMRICETEDDPATFLILTESNREREILLPVGARFSGIVTDVDSGDGLRCRALVLRSDLATEEE